MIIRHRLTVRGIVQGVGFRPFVYRLAGELALTGWVRNDGLGVCIEAEGEANDLAVFRRRLFSEKPSQAVINDISVETIPIEQTVGSAFYIRKSLRQNSTDFDAMIVPDQAVCSQCLEELFDPSDRRYRYAFIGCTDCGPRYTHTLNLPYTRESTSMAKFTQCALCQHEYESASNRRFHSEQNACPVCGPQLGLYNVAGQMIAEDPITGTLDRLYHGDIIAVKGLGGFHLICDARRADAVARLRKQKQRSEKPLALMFASVISIEEYAQISKQEKLWLDSPQRPIVLLKKRQSYDVAFPGTAFGIAWLGAMLPYTPLHYLLFHEAAKRPVGTAWLKKKQSLALVVTSANPDGEPLVSRNDEALQRVSMMADAFLMHDRDIVVPCDDSVLRVSEEGSPQFIRRARGFVPQAIHLIRSGPAVLALGAWLKNTLCLTRRQQAFVSQHIGNLETVPSCLALDRSARHLCQFFGVRPDVIACDRHPDFFSTRLAERLSKEWSLPLVAVQHHHAHVSAVLAEHGWIEPALGLALDGTGLGDDGTVWGGELLKVFAGQYERIGHLCPLPLLGGDRAVSEPWRMAASVLHGLGRNKDIVTRFPLEKEAKQVARLLLGKWNGPITSSLGRWFDAVAGLLGVQERVSYEGQAAMRLESLLAGNITLSQTAKYEIRMEQNSLLLDLFPLIQIVINATSPEKGSAVFHAGLITALADWVEQASHLTGIHVVACGGGCFQNETLSKGLRKALKDRKIVMLEACALPPNDGGLSLGQAWVAQAQFYM